jgi:PTH1 family peptidyl-tRNA hydrolase
MVADRLAARLGSTFKVHKKSGAEILTGRLSGRSVVLAKPRCYMNESGRQVGPLAKFYSVPAAGVVVIHDDLDIAFGQIRLKIDGGEGGHNGLRSVAVALGTKEFQRVRIGIGRPPGRKDPATFVLENFTAAERAEVPAVCEHAADAAELLLELGLESAQNRVHAW